MNFRNIATAASILVLSGTVAGAQAVAPETATPEGRVVGTSGIVSAQNFEAMISAQELMGRDIYSMNDGYDEGTWNTTRNFSLIGRGWEDIGEIEDIILSRDGRLVGLAVETGGWLDIGEDVVLISMDDVRLVSEGSGISVVTRMSQEELEAQPELDESWWED